MLLKSKIINFLVLKGNKMTCEKLFFKTIKTIQKQSAKNHNKLIKSIIINTSPIIKVKQVKQRSNEFPYIVFKKTRIFLALKFLIKTTKNLSGHSFYTKFNEEIIKSSKNVSNSVLQKKKFSQHAFLVRKYAHYRWF